MASLAAPCCSLQSLHLLAGAAGSQLCAVALILCFFPEQALLVSRRAAPSKGPTSALFLQKHNINREQTSTRENTHCIFSCHWVSDFKVTEIISSEKNWRNPPLVVHAGRHESDWHSAIYVVAHGLLLFLYQTSSKNFLGNCFVHGKALRSQP